MAAPVATVRQTPAGKKLENGFRVKITFDRDPDISLWEIGMTPPGVDGGDPIDTTTQWTETYREKKPRVLKDITDGAMTCAYEAAVFTQINNIINQEGTVTFQFADGTTEAHYGYLRTFQRNEMMEGQFPTATCAITITSWDYVNDVSAGPTIVSVAGT